MEFTQIQRWLIAFEYKDRTSDEKSAIILIRKGVFKSFILNGNNIFILFFLFVSYRLFLLLSCWDRKIFSRVVIVQNVSDWLKFLFDIFLFEENRKRMDWKNCTIKTSLFASWIMGLHLKKYLMCWKKDKVGISRVKLPVSDLFLLI